MNVRTLCLVSLVVIGALTGAQGPASAKQSKNQVEVFQNDMSKQCEGGGTSLADDEKKLVGIKVYARRKASDGLMHPSVCGGPTGGLNVFTIDKADLSKAITDGFAQCGVNKAECK